MKHILITGGAGYIGSVLINYLVRRNVEIVVYDTFYFGNGHLKGIRDQVGFKKIDIRQIKESDLKGIDAVIHLAAFSNDPMANFAPEINFEVNTNATERLAKLAKMSGVKRFIFASSCSIYHQGLKNTKLNTERSRVNPQEHYSKSKFLAEKRILPLADKNFVVVALRKGTVVGYSPRLRFDLVVNTMVKTALSTNKIVVFDGTQYRPMIDVRDVARAYLKVLSAPKKKINGQVFNLLNKNYSMKTLAKEVAQAFKLSLNKVVPIEIRPKQKDRTYRVSRTKIRNALGYESRYSMRQSVNGLLDYLLKTQVDYESSKYYNIACMKQLMENAPI